MKIASRGTVFLAILVVVTLLVVVAVAGWWIPRLVQDLEDRVSKLEENEESINGKLLEVESELISRDSSMEALEDEGDSLQDRIEKVEGEMGKVQETDDPSGVYVGYVPGTTGSSANPPGDVYYTFVFSADRWSEPNRMTMLMYWNTYQMFSSEAESRSLYIGECVRVDQNTWKYRMLGYLVGPHSDDIWVANDMVTIVDDLGELTFSDDSQEVTMVYDQAWFTPAQDAHPKDGLPEGEPVWGYWPGTVVAKRISATE